MAKFNLLNSIKLSKPKENYFDLSHDVKLSCNMGALVPTMCEPVVPGDKWKISCESMLRFAPLIAPVMHRMNVYMHYFFVPNRLVWPNWEKYITNTPLNDLGPAIPAHPTVTITGAPYGKLSDYLGIPNPATIAPPLINEVVSAIPFACYQKIYNEYYRDQNLVDKVPDELSDGPNTLADFDVLRYRAWEHDYFTASLPFAQKGEAVNLPLGEVVLNDDLTARQQMRFADDHALTGAHADFDINANSEPSANAGEAVVLDPNGTLDVESTTINDLRSAFAIQRWLEALARGGSRYIEFIRSMFGVRSSDKRLQRPEYITGSKSPVVISEVLNTTGTEDLPQGNMAGHAIAVTEGNYGRYFVEEYGYIIGIMSIMPRTSYFQGIPKHFLKINEPYENFVPQLANIGEQPVLNKEIYAYKAVGPNTWGYLPRYTEYKYSPSRVAGDMRTTLKQWHMARDFVTQPALNETFISADPTTRIFAVVEENVDHLYCHVFHKLDTVRPMPKFGTPQ